MRVGSEAWVSSQTTSWNAQCLRTSLVRPGDSFWVCWSTHEVRVGPEDSFWVCWSTHEVRVEPEDSFWVCWSTHEVSEGRTWGFILSLPYHSYCQLYCRGSYTTSGYNSALPGCGYISALPGYGYNSALPGCGYISALPGCDYNSALPGYGYNSKAASNHEDSLPSWMLHLHAQVIELCKYRSFLVGWSTENVPQGGFCLLELKSF